MQTELGRIRQTREDCRQDWLTMEQGIVWLPWSLDVANLYAYVETHRLLVKAVNRKDSDRSFVLAKNLASQARVLFLEA